MHYFNMKLNDGCLRLCGRWNSSFKSKFETLQIKKFDGKLEVANEAKEYGLEKFSEEVKNGILYYGFQPFFYGLSQADANKMINYVEDRHLGGSCAYCSTRAHNKIGEASSGTRSSYKQ